MMNKTENFQALYSQLLSKRIDQVVVEDKEIALEALNAYKALDKALKKALKDELAYIERVLKEVKLIESGYYAYKNKHQVILKKRIDQLKDTDQEALSEAVADYKQLSLKTRFLLRKEYAHLKRLNTELLLIALGLHTYLKSYQSALTIKLSQVEASDRATLEAAIQAHQNLPRRLRRRLIAERNLLERLLQQIDIKAEIKSYIEKHQSVFELTEALAKTDQEVAYHQAVEDWKSLSKEARRQMIRTHAQTTTKRSYFWQKRIINETYHQQPKTWIPIMIGMTILLIISLWSFSTLEFDSINQLGLQIVRGMARAMFDPNVDWLTTFRPIGIPYQMLETVAIAFLGTFVGAILAVPLAFISSRNITGKFYSYIGIFTVTMIRTFPVLILGLMFVKVTGPGPFAGVMTIGVASIGMMTKLYVESIEDIDKGILEALDATGATTFQKIRFGIIPQLTANFVSNTLYRFEINVRNATILGLVGAGGIGGTLISALNAGTYIRWQDASSALIGIIVVVLVIEVLSTRLRKKIGTGE